MIKKLLARIFKHMKILATHVFNFYIFMFVLAFLLFGIVFSTSVLFMGNIANKNKKTINEIKSALRGE